MSPRIDFRAIAKFHKTKLEKIKVILFDVDGILTDGKIYYQSDEMGFNRMFHTLDGYGMKMMMKAGFKMGIISGGNSIGLKKRCDLLKLDYVRLGNENKIPAYEEIKTLANVKDEEIAYMGDEFFDLPVLRKVGFSATVTHASMEIQESVDYVCYRAAGEGCAREVIDLIRYAQGIRPEEKGYSQLF